MLFIPLALLTKMHHAAVVDGMSGAEMLSVLARLVA